MTKEQLFFLKILADYLQQIKTEIPSDIDWNVIKKYAKSHKVEGIIYYQTKRIEFISDFAICQYAFVNIEALWKEIKEKLEQNGVEYILVKGLEVAAMYPVPSLRTMGDIDLVVKDRNRVHETMLEMGFENCVQGDHEWIYLKNQFSIEIHTHLLYEDVRNTEKMMSFEAEKWNWVKDNKLDWNYHFVFLVLHLRKHFLGDGVGFRQLMDLSVVRERGNLDWDWIYKELTELGLWNFYYICCELVDKLKQGVWTIDQEEKILYILNNGVFGFDNEENRKNHAVNKMNAYGRVGAFIRDLFYPYEKLINIPEFRFLKGKRYLLPYAWVVRVLKRVKIRKHIINRYIVSNELIEKRNSDLAVWGLR